MALFELSFETPNFIQRKRKKIPISILIINYNEAK